MAKSKATIKINFDDEIKAANVDFDQYVENNELFSELLTTDGKNALSNMFFDAVNKHFGDFELKVFSDE